MRDRSVAQLEITLIRSGIGSSKRHKEVLIGLGLRKLHKTVVREDRPEVQGMLRKVRHMVRVHEIAEGQ